MQPKRLMLWGYRERCYKITFFFFSLKFFLKFIYFLLKDDSFIVLCWFIPSINKDCLLNLKDKYLRDVSLLTNNMEKVSLSPPLVDLNNANKKI